MSESKFSVESLKITDVIKQEIKINKSSGAVKATFQSYNIKDGDYYVVYIPSLEMTGYGASIDEGYDMLKEAVEDYFDNLMKLTPHGINHELSKYGWDRSLFFKKQFSNRSLIDKNGVLKGLEMPEDTPIEANKLQMA